MDEELRSGLWNAVHIYLWEDAGTGSWRPTSEARIFSAISHLWHTFFKQPLDTIPHKLSETIKEVREVFFAADWFEVYDFVEFIAQQLSEPKKFRDFCNQVLEREKAAYRFVERDIAPISSEDEKEAIENAFSAAAGIPGVSPHLKQALDLLANRQNPDYRNSVKESISAVEGLCRYLTGDEKATLGSALPILEKQGILHGALKASWSSLYGYTSDANGIRHAMLDEPQLTYVDAKYMLVACSAFVNFMLAKISELKYQIPHKRIER
jgi:hypothetical protein